MHPVYVLRTYLKQSIVPISWYFTVLRKSIEKKVNCSNFWIPYEIDVQKLFEHKTKCCKKLSVRYYCIFIFAICAQYFFSQSISKDGFKNFERNDMLRFKYVISNFSGSQSMKIIHARYTAKWKNYNFLLITKVISWVSKCTQTSKFYCW